MDKQQAPQNQEKELAVSNINDQMITITMALKDINQGASFLGGATGHRRLPMRSLPLGYVIDEVDIVDQSATFDIVQGQIIVCKMLTPAQRSLEPQVAPSSRSVVSKTNVLIALQDIIQGSSFEAGTVGCKGVPTNELPSDIIMNEDELVSHIAKVDIIKDQIITHTMVTPTLQIPSNH